jgi:iron complex outermembrane recepter protein
MPGGAAIRIVVALAALALWGSLSPTASAQIRFDLPAQPLAQALTSLGSLANLNIYFDPALVEGYQAPALKANLDADEALTRLLAGTPLHAVRVDANTVRVVVNSTDKHAQGTHPPDTARVHPPPDMHLAYAGDSQAVNSKAGKKGRAARARHSRSTDNAAHSPDLAEVVVSAQKRDEFLQDVPVPVTALSAPQLTSSDQLRIQDFYSSVPGLSVTPANQSTQLLSIRGITTGGVTNPTVGVTVDDVPYGASTNVGGALVVPDIDPGDLTRVEVLRGPQGTLYGASSMGGLLKFVTVDPSTDALRGHIEAGVDSVYAASQAGYALRGSLNLPVGDRFAIRASGFTHLDPGYIDNPVLGNKGLNEQRVYGGRLSSLWHPTDTLSLKLSAMYQETRGNGSNVVEVPTPGYPQTATLGDLQQNDLRNTGGYNRKAQAYSATLTARLGRFDLTATSGYNVNQFHDSFDYTFGYSALAQQFLGPSGVAILNYNRADKFTQEVRLTAPLGGHIEWLLGGFYTHEKSIFSEDILAVDPTTAAIAGTLLRVPIPTRYDEYAGFTDFTLHLTDRLDIQIGARESEIRQDFSETESGAIIGVTPITIPDTDTNASAFTYLVTPRYKLTTDLMVYVRLASGYRSGGTNPLPGRGTPPQYSPDKNHDYDLGVKGDLFEHRLTVDASLYYIDWQDIQLQLYNAQTTGNYNTNGGRAKSQGIELTLEARPVDSVTLAAWASWDDAVLTENFPLNSTAVGASGDRLPNTARFSAHLSFDGQLPLWAGVTGFAGGSVSYVGNRQGLFTSQPQRQYFPAYARTDLHAGTNFNSWTTTFYINNLADKRGLLSGGLGVYPPFGFYVIQPRTIGLSLSRTF